MPIAAIIKASKTPPSGMGSNRYSIPIVAKDGSNTILRLNLSDKTPINGWEKTPMAHRSAQWNPSQKES